MPTMLRSFFDRRSQPSPEDVKAMECASLALQTRIDQLLRQDAARSAAAERPITDAYGHFLQ